MKAKRIRFPITIKRGSSIVKIYRDRRPTGIYYRVAYHIGGKRHRLHFNDLLRATSEAEAKAAQLSRGDIDAVQLTGRDRVVYGRALEAVREFGSPLDAVAIEYKRPESFLMAFRYSMRRGSIRVTTGAGSNVSRSQTRSLR